MAETFYFGNELKVYLENDKGELWQIAVTDSPSFSQETNQESVRTPTLIAGGTTRNSLNKFTKDITVGYSAASWSFSTFVRPFNQDSKERAVEDVLWESFAQGSATAYADSPSSVSSTKQDILLSKDQLLSSFNLYFVYENNTGYVVKGCVVSSASTSVDIGSLAKISWSGAGTSLEKFDPQDLVVSLDNRPNYRTGNLDTARALAMDGNTAVFGHIWENAPDTNNYDGAAHVYITNDGGNTWELQQKLYPNDVGTHEYFGASIALDGDKLVISALNRLGGDGGFYYFTRSAGVWTLVAGYSSPDFDEDQGDDDGVSGGYDDDRLGRSIAMSGDYLVTGVEGHDSTDSNDDRIGAAVLWKLVNNAWVQKDIVYNTDGTTEQFGRSVSIQGNRVVIPSRQNVYFYTTSDAGESWDLEQTLLIGSGSPIAAHNEICKYHRQGGSYGTVALGMAYQEEQGLGMSDMGTVYIITHNGAAWERTQIIYNPEPQPSDLFGKSIAFDGTTLLVSGRDDQARWNTADTPFNRGDLYQYNLKGSTWELSHTYNTSKQLNLEGALARVNFQFAFYKGNILTKSLANTTGLIDNDTFRTVVSIASDYIQLNARYNPRNYDSVLINGQRYWSINTNVDGVSNTIRLHTHPFQTESHESLVSNHTTLGLSVNDSLAFQGEHIHSWHMFKMAHHPSMCENKVGIEKTDNYIINKLSSLEFGWSENPERLYYDGLFPSTVLPNDKFGSNTAMDYPWLLVGVPGDDEGASNSGSVQAFKYDETLNTWVFMQNIRPSDPSNFSSFGGVNDGKSIAISGRTCAIGAPTEATNRGSVYIFTLQSGTTWKQEAKIVPTGTNSSTNIYFGNNVDLYQNKLIVGAWNDNPGNNAGAGSAGLYRRVGGLWSKISHLTAGSNVGTNNEFGRGVAIHDNIAVVTAAKEGVGVFYTYKTTDDGVSWTHVQRRPLTSAAPEYASSGSRNGIKLGKSILAIGDHLIDSASTINSGGVLIFKPSSTTGEFTFKTLLLPTETPNLENSDYFGLDLDIDESENGKNITVIAGGRNYDLNGVNETGSAYTWTSTDYGNSWSEGVLCSNHSPAVGDDLGTSVCTSNGHSALGAQLGEIPGSPMGSAGYVVTYRKGASFPVTSISIDMSQTIAPISYPLLGEMDKPIGFSSGTQQVSGSFSGYIMDDGGLDTKEFVSSLFEHTISTLPIQLNVGGTNSNTNRLKFDLPKVTFSNPSISSGDISTFSVAFSAEDTQEANSNSTNTVKITYKSSSVT